MVEVRCVKCKRRLFDLGENGEVQDLIIRCPKCSHDNKIKVFKTDRTLLAKVEDERSILISEI